MKLKNYTKMFVFMASLILGCCFANSAFAKETYVDSDGATIEWEIKNGVSSVGGKTLVVYGGSLDPHSLFGKFIRKKCAKEGIDLRTVMTNGAKGLGYFYMPNNDLVIDATPKCTDFEAKSWPLAALNLKSDETHEQTSPDIETPFKKVTPTRGGGYEIKDMVRVTYGSYKTIEWGRPIENILIKNPRIYAAQSFSSGRRSSEEEWTWLFRSCFDGKINGKRFVIGTRKDVAHYCEFAPIRI